MSRIRAYSPNPSRTGAMARVVPSPARRPMDAADAVPHPSGQRLDRARRQPSQTRGARRRTPPTSMSGASRKTARPKRRIGTRARVGVGEERRCRLAVYQSSNARSRGRDLPVRVPQTESVCAWAGFRWNYRPQDPTNNAPPPPPDGMWRRNPSMVPPYLGAKAPPGAFRPMAGGVRAPGRSTIESFLPLPGRSRGKPPGRRHGGTWRGRPSHPTPAMTGHIADIPSPRFKVPLSLPLYPG